MMVDNLVLVTRDGWQQLHEGALTEVPAWLTLDRPSLVLTDFEEASVGSYRMDGGKPAYAIPMIEKRARSEGLVDGQAHIVVHRTLAVHGGYQTFHTLVGLEFWQRLQQWASQQKDHCILVPLGALLSDGLRPGQARVVALGRSLHCFGHGHGGLFHASANAIGRSTDDLLASVRVLHGLVRADLAKGIDGPVAWASVLDLDVQRSEQLLAQWNDVSAVPASAVALTTFATAEGQALSALPALCRRLSLRALLNPWLDRVAWWSENLVAGLAAVVAVVAVGLGGLGLYARVQSKVEHDRSAQAQRELQVLEARIEATNAQDIPTAFAPVADFARKLGDGARYDPLPMLATLKAAAGREIVIKRLRLESVGDRERSFRVDGFTQSGSVEALSQFLGHLKTAGWSASPLEPGEAGPRAFSYRLMATSGRRG